MIARRLAVRFSSSTPVAPKNYEQTANRIIDFFPGSNLKTKTTSFLAISSLATFLISKEIYVFDLETVEVFCLFGAWYAWYKGSKSFFSDHFRTKKEDIARVLSQARRDHAAVVQERIDHVSKLADAVPVTNALYDMSKEIATMEHQVYELKQKVSFVQNVKAQLDALERFEANQREQQQKLLAQQVKERIQQLLTDPKLQERALSQSLKDLETLK